MQFSSKHKQREQTFMFDGFEDGYTQEKSDAFLSKNELSSCMNLKYVSRKTDLGKKVSLRKRPGTIRVSNTALPGSSEVMAATYYINQAKYILATTTRLYYLDRLYNPIEIGTIEGIPTFTEFNSKLIIHDGGTTKSWDGTIFQKIHRTFIDELLATGDNSETEFTGTFSNPTIVESTHESVATPLSITFTDTTAKEINDDGLGRLTGNVSAGWVKNISDCDDNGSGLIRVTSNAHGFDDGDEVNIQDVVGTVEANNDLTNPTWTVVNKDTNYFDLTGSAFAVAYTSGGTVSKHTVIYTTGVYAFECDGAPDSSTLVEADYEEQDGGEESSAGFVRGSRLYLTGCPDHLSRMYYTVANDERGVDTSAGGGYLDIDPNDGYELKGGINFETSILLGKGNSLHRIDDYPGDATFKVEKITDDLGFVSHRTHLFEGGIVSFMSKEGWTAMHPTERYGDIQKGVSLSEAFSTNAVKYDNSYAYSAYNSTEKQLWLALSDLHGNYLDYVFVINMETGGQLSLYKFKFGHSCFAYANGEMLIGGEDGYLYKLDKTNSIFEDNEVDYSDECYARTGFIDWELPFNWKHNKKMYMKLSGSPGAGVTVDIYTDENYTSNKSVSFSLTVAWNEIYTYSGTLIYSVTGKISKDNRTVETKNKFDYRSVMFHFGNITGTQGTELLGVNLQTAFIGDR